MTLSNAQIDRYSRQIIVPRIGGRGQEHLLASRMLIAGDEHDIETPRAYLAGAGVGTIVAANEAHGELDLALMIVGSEASRNAAIELARAGRARALVIARLDTPGAIALMPNASAPLDARIVAAYGRRSEHAEIIAMLATVEAFKLLAGYHENPTPALIEFSDYATRIAAHP